MGGVRHVADIRADDMSKEGQGVIGLQAGSNKGASQSGMSMGGARHAADIRADDMSKDGAGVIGLQAGSMTDPPALAFANTIAGSHAPAISYASVYPLTMLLRITVAQVLVILLGG